MNLAVSKLKKPVEDGSALQWAHQRLTMMLMNGKFLPAFTPLASRGRLDGQNQSILVAADSYKAI